MSGTLFAGCAFRAFAQPLAAGGRAMALNVPRAAAEITRSQLDQLEAFAKGFGAKGLAWFKIGPDGHHLAGGQVPLRRTLLQRFRERMDGEAGRPAAPLRGPAEGGGRRHGAAAAQASATSSS